MNKYGDHRPHGYHITINCICGKSYDTYIGPGSTPLTEPKNDKYRYHTCPHCKYKWDLMPEIKTNPYK